VSIINYLITGGAGFIGSHLSDALIARGDSVTVIDNLTTGNNLLDKKIEFHKASIFDNHLIDKLVSKTDHVIHLAASVGVFTIINKPLESLINNIRGTEVLLEASHKHNKPIFISSTSEVYGKNNSVPLNENSDRILGSPFISRWSYSEAKAIDESLSYFYYLEKNLNVRIARFFNTVGPRQSGNYGMVLPRFVNSALKDKPLEVYGDGSQIRCFCHIKDVIRAILLIIDSNTTIGDVFNIGNNFQISMQSLAEKVVKILGSNSKILNIPYSEVYSSGFEDMQLRVPDISKIQKILGWEPQINLEQIIEDVATFIGKK